jgi:hypothetical protein
MTPLLCGYRPVKREARLGLHWGAVQKQFAKRAPSAAKASIRGVWTVSTP